MDDINVPEIEHEDGPTATVDFYKMMKLVRFADQMAAVLMDIDTIGDNVDKNDILDAAKTLVAQYWEFRGFANADEGTSEASTVQEVSSPEQPEQDIPEVPASSEVTDSM